MQDSSSLSDHLHYLHYSENVLPPVILTLNYDILSIASKG